MAVAHIEHRGKKWVAIYAEPTNKSGKGAKSYDRKKDAENFLADQVVKSLNGTWIDPKAGRVTLGVYAEQWLAMHDVRDSTKRTLRQHLKHILDGKPRLRDVPLADLRPSVLREWQAGLTCAPSTAVVIRSTFSAILNAAVIDMFITASPFAGIRRPRVDRKLINPMSAERVHAIHDAINPRFAAAITAGAGTGLRRGECMGLTIDRVDFLRRVVTVDRQLVGVKAKLPVFGPPKTPESVRKVPAPQYVLDELAAHLSQYPAGPDGLIFTTATGLPVHPIRFGEAWTDAEIRLWSGIPGRISHDRRQAFNEAHPDGHGHRFHELRHFYVSVLVADGASIRVIQARIGHAPGSPETLKTYAHLWPEDEDRTRAAIDAALTARRKDVNHEAL